MSKQIRFTDIVDGNQIWTTIGVVGGRWMGIDDPGGGEGEPESAAELRVYASLFVQAADECDRLNAAEKPKVRKFQHSGWLGPNECIFELREDGSVWETNTRDGPTHRDYDDAASVANNLNGGYWVEITNDPPF